MSRSLLAHARLPSLSLTLKPRRPDPPLRGRAPAGCRSGQQRTRASRHLQASKSTVHAVGRVHTATPANADAEGPRHLPLPSPRPPCTTSGIFNPHRPSCPRFLPPDRTTTSPLTPQKHPRASQLLSRAEKEPVVLAAPEKKVD
jgi:hypothetical protein